MSIWKLGVSRAAYSILSGNSEKETMKIVNDHLIQIYPKHNYAAGQKMYREAKELAANQFLKQGEEQ